MWIARTCKGHSLGNIIVKLVFAATVYVLWRERNNRMYKGEARRQGLVLMEIISTVRAKVSTIGKGRQWTDPLFLRTKNEQARDERPGVFQLDSKRTRLLVITEMVTPRTASWRCPVLSRTLYYPTKDSSTIYPNMHILKSHCLRRDSRWGPEQENAFQYFKECLVTAPVSRLGQVISCTCLCFSLRYLLYIGSRRAFQTRSSHFWSRRLSPAERNYTTTEREGLAMVHSVQKFRH